MYSQSNFHLHMCTILPPSPMLSVKVMNIFKLRFALIIYACKLFLSLSRAFNSSQPIYPSTTKALIAVFEHCSCTHHTYPSCLSSFHMVHEMAALNAAAPSPCLKWGLEEASDFLLPSSPTSCLLMIDLSVPI